LSQKKSKEGTVQSPEKTPKLLRFTSKSSSKGESHKTSAEGDQDTRDINKNLLASSSGTPSQKRKHVFLEKVQKYIHQNNNKKQQRKHSLDTLLDGPRTHRSISTGDLLDTGYPENQSLSSNRKAKSFQNQKGGNDSITKYNKDFSEHNNDQNKDTDGFDSLLIHEPLRKRASTLGTMDELPIQIISPKHPSWDSELITDETNHQKNNQQQREPCNKSRNSSTSGSRVDEFTENDSLLHSCSNESNYGNTNDTLPNGGSIDAFVVVKSPVESSASGNDIKKTDGIS
jgi:hypothetical protein